MPLPGSDSQQLNNPPTKIKNNNTVDHLQMKKNKNNHSMKVIIKNIEGEDRTTTGWILYRFFFWGSFSLLSYNLYLVSNHENDTPVENETGALPGFIGVAKFIYGEYNKATEV